MHEDGAVKEIASLQQEIGKLQNELTLGVSLDNRPDCLKANTLDSIAKYLKYNPDSVKPENCIVSVGMNRVVLYSQVKGAKNNRHAIMEVRPVDFETLTEGRLMDQQNMIIELLTRCMRTDEVDELVHKIGSMTYVEKGTSDDDGVSTDLMMSVSVLCNNGKPKRHVVLRPYRIFPEVEQPSSPFLVRVESSDKRPVVGLYLADGGLWKVVAINNITNYLYEILPDEVSIIS